MATPLQIAAMKKKIIKLELRVKALETRVRTMEKCCKQVEKWIKLEVKWSKEVTGMLQAVDWACLTAQCPGGGGANPPQTPPDWPPA